MSFFIRKDRPGAAAAPKRNLKKRHMNEEVSSESEEEGTAKLPARDSGSEEDESETANQKRLRLAKQYLADIQHQVEEKAENEEEVNKLVSERLKQDALAESGRLQKFVADLYVPCTSGDIRVFRAHKLSVTCVALSETNSLAFSGSKDGAIVKWDIAQGKRLKTVPGLKPKDPESAVGHRGAVFALSVSTNFAYLASGGADKNVLIWNPESMTVVKKFTGHKQAVSALAFRRSSLELFSASLDRSVKLWNLAEMGYVETMFGHQDQILSIDCLLRERPLTCGARDRTLRAWKVADESQLLFRAHASCGSVDCCTLVNEDHFLSGADDGSLSLWSVMKKKPTGIKFHAHAQPEEPGNVEQVLLPKPAQPIGIGDSGHVTDDDDLGKGEAKNPTDRCCWITAVAAYKYSDLVASGSCDGFVRLWKVGTGYRTLQKLFEIPVAGFVNDLAFSSDGLKLVCAVGQEHKQGRWWRVKEARNSFVVISLHTNSYPTPSRC